MNMNSPDFNNDIPIWGATTRAAANSVCSSPSNVPSESKSEIKEKKGMR